MLLTSFGVISVGRIPGPRAGDRRTGASSGRKQQPKPPQLELGGEEVGSGQESRD